MIIEKQFIPEGENMTIEKEGEKIILMEDFIQKCLEDKRDGDNFVSLEKLNNLKEQGISTEMFLDHLCKRHDKLLHGSIQEITEKKLRSNNGKIFSSNKSAIAILKSLHSNRGARLHYPYFIDENNSLILEIKTDLEIELIKKQKGFIYVLDKEDFVNDPEGSWQFVKKDDANIQLIIETEENDFTYPVHVTNNSESE